MLKPRRKTIIGMVIILLLCLNMFIVYLGFVALNAFLRMEGEDTDNKSKEEYQMQGIVETAETLGWNLEDAYQKFYSQSQAKVNLVAAAVKSEVAEKGDGCIDLLEEGGVVKIENGKATLPQGLRTGIYNYADQITEEEGRLIYDTVTASGIRKDILFYSHISGPYYYVEIINGNELLDYIDKYTQYKDTLQGIEAAYGIDLYVICPDYKNNPYFFNLQGNLVYSWDSYDDYLNNGYEHSNYKNAEDVGLPSDPDYIMAMDQMMETDQETGRIDIYLCRESEALGCFLVMHTNDIGDMANMVDQLLTGLMFSFVLAVLFLIWVVSVYKEMTTGILTEEKKKKYSPGKVRIISISYGILSILLVFALSIYVRSLHNIHQEIEDSSVILDVLDYKLDNVDQKEEILDKSRKNLYMQYGVRAAHMLEEHPELNSKEKLKKLDEIIGSEYIMTFDSNGKEVSTSSDYIDMELGDENADNPSSTADFRRILKGVPGIAHNAFKDEVTGEELELIGVRMKDTANGGYGVLLMAFTPTDRTVARDNNIYNIMQSLIPAGKVCFTVDLSDKIVKSSTTSDVVLFYASTEALGIKDSQLKGGVTDFITIDGYRYFCVSSEDKEDNVVRYIATPNETLYSDCLEFGLINAIGYAILFLILCMYLLSGYSAKKLNDIEAMQNEVFPEEQTENENAPDSAVEQTPEENTDEKERKRRKGFGLFKKLSRFKETFFRWAKVTTPEKKALFALRIFFAIAIIRMILDFLTDRNWQENNVLIAYIVSGKWNRGLNLFSLSGILILALTLIIAMMMVRIIFRLIGRMLNPRGQTICELIVNMIGYLAVMIFFYYALAYLGVDTNAILASVGVIGIGISMGARDLIADVFAGISTIFEGSYQVGDIVNIDGYRGMVQEIGVRSTRVVGRGGNVRIFSNKNIKSVVNLTKMNSWVAVTIKVDVLYPLEDVEAILSETLPKIADNCVEIISGPYYKGVLSIEAGFAVLSIIAECREDDYYKVERTLIRDVLVALREKNVPVK